MAGSRNLAQTTVCQTPGVNIYSERLADFNRYVTWFKQSGMDKSAALKVIPTVIHVIYRNSSDSELITRARINGQVEAANKQLRRLNENARKTRSIFLPVAADCDIQVCLATRKPDQKRFTGVLYHYYPGYQFSDLDSIRAATALDPDRYLNVWIIPATTSAAAVFPWLKTPSLDGFIVGAKAFGTEGADLDPVNNLGVTFTHELAHYLGVLHTFDNGTAYQYRCDLVHDGSIADFCSDTPLDWELSFVYNSCNNGVRFCLNEEPVTSFFVQSENYMYYAFDSCLNMFSKDQRARMRACLQGIRWKLSSLSNLNFTSVNYRDIWKYYKVPSFPPGSIYDKLNAYKAGRGKKIVVAPNPTSGIVHILYRDVFLKKEISIKVYNQFGQKLKEAHSHSLINEIDISAFPDGIYYLIITTDNISETNYVVKIGAGRGLVK
ncbi:MAG: M43 family zinc metalloprotease [Bacteroidota bacterium]